jgi:hypothetical protein
MGLLLLLPLLLKALLAAQQRLRQLPAPLVRMLPPLTGPPRAPAGTPASLSRRRQTGAGQTARAACALALPAARLGRPLAAPPGLPQATGVAAGRRRTLPRAGPRSAQPLLLLPPLLPARAWRAFAWTVGRPRLRLQQSPVLPLWCRPLPATAAAAAAAAVWAAHCPVLACWH